MIRRIVTNAHVHPLKNYKILINNEYACSAYSMGKVIIIPSKSKVASESPKFLEKHKKIYVD